MKFETILETARRIGIPVVITNERGESPQVVMPFEDFAAMVGAGSANRVRKASHAPDDAVAEALAEYTRERLEETQQEGAEQLQSELRSMQGTDESFLEEKFYLEPLEGDEKK